MKMLTVLAAVAVAIATCSLHATPSYRYAWVPFDQGNTSPAPLDTPGSGFIDFLAPTDGGIGAGLDAISDLQFTGFSANGSGLLPDIPSFTYDLSNALSPSGDGIMWNSQRITSIGITLFNPLAPGTSSNISDHRVETFYPLAYFPNDHARATGYFKAPSRSLKPAATLPS